MTLELSIKDLECFKVATDQKWRAIVKHDYIRKSVQDKEIVFQRIMERIEAYIKTNPLVAWLHREGFALAETLDLLAPYGPELINLLLQLSAPHNLDRFAHVINPSFKLHIQAPETTVAGALIGLADTKPLLFFFNWYCSKPVRWINGDWLGTLRDTVNRCGLDSSQLLSVLYGDHWQEQSHLLWPEVTLLSPGDLLAQCWRKVLTSVNWATHRRLEALLEDTKLTPKWFRIKAFLDNGKPQVLPSQKEKIELRSKFSNAPEFPSSPLLSGGPIGGDLFSSNGRPRSKQALLAAISAEIESRGGRVLCGDTDSLLFSGDLGDDEIKDIVKRLSGDQHVSCLRRQVVGPPTSDPTNPNWFKEQLAAHINGAREAGAIELRDRILEALSNGKVPNVTSYSAVWAITQLLRNLDVTSPSTLPLLANLVEGLGVPRRQPSDPHVNQLRNLVEKQIQTAHKVDPIGPASFLLDTIKEKLDELAQEPVSDDQTTSVPPEFVPPSPATSAPVYVKKYSDPYVDQLRELVEKHIKEAHEVDSIELCGLLLDALKEKLDELAQESKFLKEDGPTPTPSISPRPIGQSDPKAQD